MVSFEFAIASQSCASLFDSQFEPVFEAHLFPHSANSPISANSPNKDDLHKLYVDWAIKTSKKIRTMYLKGKSIFDIFDHVATARGVLAKRQGMFDDLRGQVFGKLTFNPRARSPWTVFPGKLERIQGSPLDELIYSTATRRQLNHQLARQGENLKDLGAERLPIYVVNSLITVSGRRIELSSLHFHKRYFDSEGGFKILHPYSIPNAKNPDLIEGFAGAAFRDAIDRIELLRSREMSENDKIYHFASAMYAFYNSMPYPRGSSSIGRVIFTALYSEIFGRAPVKFEDGIDVLAMVSEQNEFINYIRHFLENSSK